MPAESRPGDDLRLLILAKAPVPGQVKTRLMPPLSAEQACAVHVALLEQTLATATRAFPAPCIQLWTALQHDHLTLQRLAERFAIACHAQQGDDLGERMYHAWATQDAPSLVIGSDCPPLSVELLQDCAQALPSHDIVMLPAEDGGYGLIGGRRPHPGLFEDIAWGSSQVAETTRQRIHALGWNLACPGTVWDVDTPDDLARWRGLSTQTTPCPAQSMDPRRTR